MGNRKSIHVGFCLLNNDVYVGSYLVFVVRSWYNSTLKVFSVFVLDPISVNSPMLTAAEKSTSLMPTTAGGPTTLVSTGAVLPNMVC